MAKEEYLGKIVTALSGVNQGKAPELSHIKRIASALEGVTKASGKSVVDILSNGGGSSVLQFHIDTTDTEHVIVNTDEKGVVISVLVQTVCKDLIDKISEEVANGHYPFLQITMDDTSIINTLSLFDTESYGEGSMYSYMTSLNNVEVQAEAGVFNQVVLGKIPNEENPNEMMYLLNAVWHSAKNYLKVPEDTKLSDHVDDIIGYYGRWSDSGTENVPTCSQVNKAIVRHWNYTTAQLANGIAYGTDELSYDINALIWRTSDNKCFFKVPYICSELKTIMTNNTPAAESGKTFIPQTAYSNDNSLLILYRRSNSSGGEWAGKLLYVAAS